MKSAFNISLKSIKMAGIEFMGNVEVSVSQSDDQYHTELNLAVNKVKTEDIDLDMDLQLSLSSDFSEKEYVESLESALEDLMSDDKTRSVKKLEDKYSIELPYMRQVTEDITPVAQKLTEKLSPLFDMISELDSSSDSTGEPIDLDLGGDSTDEPIDLDLGDDDTVTSGDPEVIQVTVSPDTEHETVHEVPSDSDPIDDIHYWYRYILKNKNDVDEIRIKWMDGSQVTLIKSKYIYSKYGRKSARRVGDVFYYYRVDANHGKLGDMKEGIFTEL